MTTTLMLRRRSSWRSSGISTRIPHLFSNGSLVSLIVGEVWMWTCPLFTCRNFIFALTAATTKAGLSHLNLLTAPSYRKLISEQNWSGVHGWRVSSLFSHVIIDNFLVNTNGNSAAGTHSPGTALSKSLDPQ